MTHLARNSRAEGVAGRSYCRREATHVEAIQDRAHGSFAFGDLNCDERFNAFDIEPFLVALIDPDDYRERFPNCDINLGDINGDGWVNAFDIQPFLDLLFGP